ncbi:hypothetical protein P7K49_033985, partial [Saguinus oedipus]
MEENKEGAEMVSGPHFPEKSPNKKLKPTYWNKKDPVDKKEAAAQKRSMCDYGKLEIEVPEVNLQFFQEHRRCVNQCPQESREREQGIRA